MPAGTGGGGADGPRRQAEGARAEHRVGGAERRDGDRRARADVDAARRAWRLAQEATCSRP